MALRSFGWKRLRSLCSTWFGTLLKMALRQKMITVHLIVWRLERSEVLLVILRGQESIIGWNLECGAPWLEGQRVMKPCHPFGETRNP